MLRKALRWLKRLVLGAIALAVLAIVAVVIALHTDWGRERVRVRIEAALRDQFPGGASVGRLEGSVFGELVLRDVVLNGLDQQPIAKIGTLRVEVALLPLIGKTARVDRLVAEDVAIWVRPQPPAPPEEPSGPSSWDVELRHVEVHRAKLSIATATTPIVLDGAELVVAAELPAGGPITATATVRGTWRRDRPVPIAATATLRFDDTLVMPLVAATIGGVSIMGTAVTPIAPSGRLVIAATAAGAPELGLPGDLVAVIDATATSYPAQVELMSAIGAESVRGSFGVDLAAGRIGGVMTTTTEQLARLTGGRIAGRGTTVVAVVTDGIVVRGSIAAVGRVDGGPASATLITYEASARGVHAIAGGAGDDHVRAIALGSLARTGASLEIEHAAVFARADDLRALIGNAAPIGGDAAIELTASGPPDALAISAHVRGTHLRHRDRALGAFELDADTLLRPGSALEIALGRHEVRTADGDTWSGRGGHVTIDGDRVTLRDVRTTHGGAALALAGSYERGDVAATVTATRVPAAAIDRASRGIVGGTLAFEHARGRWRGQADVTVVGLAVGGRLPIDGTARIRLDGRRLDVTAHGSEPRIGSADVALALDGPRDLADVDGWRALERRDLREVTVAVHHVDLGTLEPRASGVVDGTATITASEIRGGLTLRGAATHAGRVDADLAVAVGDAGAITATGRAALDGAGAAELGVAIAIPDRLLDPGAWRRLGAGVLRGGTIALHDVPFDPALLARFGIVAPYRGRASAAISIGPGGRRTQLSIDATDVRGGSIAVPLALHAEAETDGADLRVQLAARTARAPVIELAATLPISLPRLAGGGLAGALATPITGTATIRTAPLPQLLAIIDRHDVTRGTIEGGVTIGGTLGAPTASATLTVRGVAVVPPIAGRPAPTLDELVVAASWDGASGSFDARGRESDGGTLHVTASGRPDAIASAVASIDVRRFELAPLAALLPGPLVSASGRLDGLLGLRGLDPATSHVDGRLTVADGRVPLSPKLGILRHTRAELAIDGRGLDVKLDGELGAGHVALVGKGDVDTIAATMTLRQVSPVMSVRPAIDADVTLHLRRGPDRWGGEVQVRNGVVTIPPESGDALLDAGAPSDLIFADGAVEPAALAPPPPPAHPWLAVEVDVGSTRIEGRGLRGSIAGRLDVTIGGESIGIYRRLEVEHLDIDDLFGRHYQVDRGAVTFVGTTDGLLDVRLVHDFPDLALIVDVGGTVSDPTVAFSSTPGGYTRDQLLGFFIGGEPGGDPNHATREAATGASASFLSQKLGRPLNAVLPVKIDVLRCEPATSATSAACTVGKWLSERLFLAYEQHLAAKADENGGDVQVKYYLGHDILIEGSAGDRNHDNVDVLWRHRW